MKWAALWIAIVTLAAGSMLGEDVGCSRAFVSGSWSLLRLAAYGQSTYEHAAFIVRDDSGEARLVPWPFDRQAFEATFHGAVPPNAIAIVHTHPNSVPLPSAGDAALARRLGLPVYVVTRTLVSRTNGNSTATIWSGDWNPERDAGGRSRCVSATIAQVQ